MNHEINTIPENDLIRLKNLYQYEILDTSPEDDFDTIASLAAVLFETDNAHISFVDTSHVFYKANLPGKTENKIPRKNSLCALSILKKEATVLYDSPLLSAEIRFYAAVPIISTDGFALGTIGVTDSKPHKQVTEQQLKMLSMLSELVQEKLETRLSALKTERAYQARLRRLAHDLKNPVASISLYAQLLGSRAMNTEKVFSMASKIEISTKRIEDNLNNLFFSTD